MISHAMVGTADLDRAVRFSSPIMDVLGNEMCSHDEGRGWAGWRKPGATRPIFLIGHPHDGQPTHPGNGTMVAFLAPGRAAVDRAHRLALDNGGLSEGEPGLRPEYHPHFYGAYFRDPDGNKLCVCCHDPE